VADGYVQDHFSQAEPSCEFQRTLKGKHCREPGETRIDGLAVCGRHAERLRLEERVAYWRAILAHVDLWSGEAQRRGRGDVVGLLDVERKRTARALERACAALQKDMGGRSRDGPGGEAASRDGDDGLARTVRARLGSRHCDGRYCS
jgi:hypothetical protein